MRLSRMAWIFCDSRRATRFASAAALGLVIAGSGAVARAQAPVPPPGPPPLTQPSVPVLPGQPRPLVSVPLAVATPLATTVPVPTASPTPAARTFNCSCFTAASGTEWAGTVQAQSYSAARGAATSACLAYITSSPQSPFIPPGQSPGLPAFESTPAPSGATTSSSSSSGVPGAAPNNPASGLENSPSITGQTFCNVCACN
jgi:hypothetical protein